MYKNLRFSCSSVLYPVVLIDQHLQLVETFQWQANNYLTFGVTFNMEKSIQ